MRNNLAAILYNNVLCWFLFLRSNSFIFFLLAAISVGNTPAKAITCTDLLSGEGIVSELYPAPQEFQDWLPVIDYLRTSKEIDKAIYTTILPAADALSTELKQKLLPLLVGNYHQLKKSPNRRAVEVLFHHLYRVDISIFSLMEQGLSVVEAYSRTIEEVSRILGTEKPFDFSDIKNIIGEIQNLIRKGDIVYIVGSATTGKSNVGKSDVDIRYRRVLPRWWDWLLSKLPYLLRSKIVYKFDSNLTRGINQKLKERYDVKYFAEVLNITERDGFGTDTWKSFGGENPFILEVSTDGVFLNIFEPPEAITKFGEMFGVDGVVRKKNYVLINEGSYRRIPFK